MYLKRMFVIVVLLGCVMLSHSKKNRRGGGREAKYLNFNVLDGDISIELDFSIPFVSIPVKKTVDSITGGMAFPPVSVNVAALAVGGVAVFFTAIIVPFLIRHFAFHEIPAYGRILDNTKFGADSMLEFANQLFMDKWAVQGCAQRVACWTARKSDTLDATGLLHHVSHNAILNNLMNISAVEDAFLSGKHGKDCGDYGPCTIKDEHLPIFMETISRFGAG